MAPEYDSDLYADLYGDDEEESQATTQPQTELKATNGVVQSNHTTSTVGTTNASGTTPTSIESSNKQNAVPSGSYASQVAQQFQSYQKQQTNPSQPLASSLSPTTPSSSLNPHFSSAVPSLPVQQLSTVRPSEMKDEGKMFIGGLNWDTTDDTLRNYMSQFGAVDACTIMRDPTGRSRGFAFLRFEEAESVDAVMTHGEHVLDGKVIDPKRAVPRQEYLRHQRVFVGGLPPSVTSASLRTSFSQYGEVVDCMVMLDRETNRSKGFGFVTYNDVSGMEAVLAAAPIELDGKVIEVKEATPRNAQHRPGVKSQADSEQQHGAQPQETPNFAPSNSGANNFNPTQMAQLYSRMMQNMGMGNMGMGMMGMGGMPMGGMGGMGLGGMGGMMNPMMMNGGMGMGGMNMGMMNPMGMMGYGMNAGGMGMTASKPSTQAAATSARGGRGGMVGGSGGPSRMVNRGANNFHPYSR